MKKITILRTMTAIALMFAVNITAYAQFAGGAGTRQNPYQIATVEQLVQLATYVNVADTNYNNKIYILQNDLDLNVEPYNTGKGWIPIGKLVTWGNQQPFKGVFNGNHKKITGLYINDTALNFAGLFGLLAEGATVRGIGLENVNIVARDYVGGVVGFVFTGEVRSSHTTGRIEGRQWVGGIVGGTDVTEIALCYSTANVSGSGLLGGIAGDVNENSHLSDCYSTGNVTGIHDMVGGIAGRVSHESSLSRSYATGTISGRWEVGGIAGVLAFDNTLSNCVALNLRVTETGGTDEVGRVAGANHESTLANNAAFINMRNKDNNTTWNNKGADEIDGADITSQTITTDGSLGGRFGAPIWTVENGKLPGLLDSTVDIPKHLHEQMTSIRTVSDNMVVRVYPNPTQGELRITNYELGIGNDNIGANPRLLSEVEVRVRSITIYDISGRFVGVYYLRSAIETTIDISHLPTGIYFLKIGDEMVKVVKN